MAEELDPTPAGDEPLPGKFSEEDVAELLQLLAPHLAELGAQIVEAAVAATPVPTNRPGTVTAVNVTVTPHTATVLCDGDRVGIDAMVLCEMPVVNDRVMVQFMPPSAAYVIGHLNGNGVPAGTIAAFGGSITADQSSATEQGPPRGWLWMHNQVVAQASYPALYAAIGDTYNIGGEAASDFRIPDGRGRVLLGLDNMGGSDAGRLSMSNTLGGTGGSETHTLSTSQLPYHEHDLAGHTHSTPSHQHGLGSHTHSFSGTTSTGGSHTHATVSGVNMAQQAGWQHSGGAGFPWVSSDPGSPTTGSGGSHNHSVSGTTGSASGSTSFDGSGTTGGAFGNTGGVGSGSPVNHLPPYMLVHYIIKG